MAFLCWCHCLQVTFQIDDVNELERDQIACVSAAKQFMLPKESQQTVEVKANWGRARKQYGPSATDIMVTTQNNQNVNVSVQFFNTLPISVTES